MIVSLLCALYLGLILTLTFWADWSIKIFGDKKRISIILGYVIATVLALMLTCGLIAVVGMAERVLI